MLTPTRRDPGGALPQNSCYPGSAHWCAPVGSVDHPVAARAEPGQVQVSLAALGPESAWKRAGSAGERLALYSRPLRELRGVVKRITFQNPDNGYTVAWLAPERDDAVLERPAHQLGHVLAELRQLVQEQHHAVGQAQLAGPFRAPPARAAAQPPIRSGSRRRDYAGSASAISEPLPDVPGSAMTTV